VTSSSTQVAAAAGAQRLLQVRVQGVAAQVLREEVQSHREVGLRQRRAQLAQRAG
jgi:hypothetical protein